MSTTNKLISSLHSGSKVQLTSPNGSYHLVMQQDGNLVVYRGTTFTPPNAVYATASNVGSGGPFSLVLEPTGNLTIKNGRENLIWSSNTPSKIAPCTLILTDNGKLEMVDGNGKNYWISPETHPQNRQPNQYPGYNAQPQPQPNQYPGYHAQPQPNQYPGYHAQPQPNQYQQYPGYAVPPTPQPVYGTPIPTANGYSYLVDAIIDPQELTSTLVNTLFSADLQYKLVLQSDGQLCLYHAVYNNLIWRSNSKPGIGPFKFIMQSDGNAVIYDSTQKCVYHTSTWDQNATNNKPFTLRVHREGYVSIHNKNNKELWNSK